MTSEYKLHNQGRRQWYGWYGHGRSSFQVGKNGVAWILTYTCVTSSKVLFRLKYDEASLDFSRLQVSKVTMRALRLSWISARHLGTRLRPCSVKFGVGLMCTEFNFASLQTLKTRPDQAFQSTNTSFLCPELGKSAPVRRSFQAAWFNWISEAALKIGESVLFTAKRVGGM